MNFTDIFYLIIGIIILIYIITRAVIALIRKIKGLDKESREAVLQFTAYLIENGVKIPDDMMVKILRGKLPIEELSKEFSSLVKGA